MSVILIREGGGIFKTQIQRGRPIGEGHVKSEVGNEVMSLQAKDCQLPSEARREAWNIFCLRGINTADSLRSDFLPPEL